VSYDDWKCNAPDPGSAGNGERPERRTRALFFEGFRIAHRYGTAEAYLENYRQAPRFAALVAEAEAMLRHPASCDCQSCMKVGA
jgi:hypothetical protein